MIKISALVGAFEIESFLVETKLDLFVLKGRAYHVAFICRPIAGVIILEWDTQRIDSSPNCESSIPGLVDPKAEVKFVPW